MKWLPHFVNPSIYKDYDLSKDIDWLIMGNIRKKSYPLRRKMIEVMSGRPGFVYHKHPGYRDIKEDEKDHLFIGENFSREINRSKIFLTCNLIYKYPIRKYYEVLASKTLLLAPQCVELIELGFIPGEHFIEINEDNFSQKAEYYLTHEKERMEIEEALRRQTIFEDNGIKITWFDRRTEGSCLVPEMIGLQDTPYDVIVLRPPEMTKRYIGVLYQLRLLVMIIEYCVYRA